jgi:hypothetical protein
LLHLVSLLLTFAKFGLFVKNLVLTHFLPRHLPADAWRTGRVLPAPTVCVERREHAAALDEQLSVSALLPKAVGAAPVESASRSPRINAIFSYQLN